MAAFTKRINKQNVRTTRHGKIFRSFVGSEFLSKNKNLRLHVTKLFFVVFPFVFVMYYQTPQLFDENFCCFCDLVPFSGGLALSFIRGFGTGKQMV